MNDLECRLKELIISKYGSMTKFAEKINMPWTTLDSILKRGVVNSNVANVFKITKELDISAEKLINGKIEYMSTLMLSVPLDREEYTNAELKEIMQFAEFVKNKRGQ